ncbi:hypothetical protein AAFF_G00039790 [Aldrovandia affinis]|uniref:Uncharacterized protein n=1 Tax=Aldrovandia affinis TaxID=143900 RepID=A0AAD7S392_9TELE|nr:hypothetical protein AAFF_G00039790 [Aldrovandia affinis]
MGCDHSVVLPPFRPRENDNMSKQCAACWRGECVISGDFRVRAQSGSLGASQHFHELARIAITKGPCFHLLADLSGSEVSRESRGRLLQQGAKTLLI